jgi:tripartite-type tricarboxylate transporter receptor subunit TctC
MEETMGANGKTEINPINRNGPTRRSVILGSAAAALALLSPAGATAQEWPSRPIELVVPFAPGGGTDLLARALADELSKQLSVPVQVVNRAGGGGVVGFEDIKAAKPDGYTLGILTAQLITANLRGVMKTSYKDFAPVAMLAIDYAGLSVQTDSKWKTLPEFLDYAKANPGSVTVGNGSQGGSFHMLARNLEEAAGVKFKHVPFDGGQRRYRDTALHPIGTVAHARGGWNEAVRRSSRCTDLGRIGLSTGYRHVARSGNAEGYAS